MLIDLDAWALARENNGPMKQTMAAADVMCIRESTERLPATHSRSVPDSQKDVKGRYFRK